MSVAQLQAYALKISGTMASASSNERRLQALLDVIEAALASLVSADLAVTSQERIAADSSQSAGSAGGFPRLLIKIVGHPLIIATPRAPLVHSGIPIVDLVARDGLLFSIEWSGVWRIGDTAVTAESFATALLSALPATRV